MIIKIVERSSGKYDLILRQDKYHSIQLPISAYNLQEAKATAAQVHRGLMCTSESITVDYDNIVRRSTAGSCTSLKIHRPVGTVWKDEECEKKFMWKLQAPKGILSFPRRKDALVMQKTTEGLK